MSQQNDEPLLLAAIDGANPLGFLAALGTLVTARRFCPDARLSWTNHGGAWRPQVHGCSRNRDELAERLLDALKGQDTEALEIDNKLPFEAERLAKHLRKAQQRATGDDRRLADFLAAFGTEMHPVGEIFQDSHFRMVRSGDSVGQGLPAYALTNRAKLDLSALNRTLFHGWDYADAGSSLRWDPLEDQRYALRWRDPSKSGKGDGPASMLGANCLAVEALQLFPVQPRGTRADTTGFYRDANRRLHFSWPIWTPPLPLDPVRSLLVLRDLHAERPPRDLLLARGIVEIYRSQRIAQSKYYNNFAPAQPA